MRAEAAINLGTTWVYGFFVKTKEYRASQYDHAADVYEKVPLSQRSKTIAGKEVQRDLYSAFLLKNTDMSLGHPDREKCIRTFVRFLRLQEEQISEMKQNNRSM